jgi:hypothetical protein
VKKPGVKFAFKDTDKGWKALARRAKAMGKRAHVKVGLVGKRAQQVEKVEGEARPLTVAAIAAVNEFGSPERRIPARPFIGGSFDAHVEEYRLLLRQVADGVLTGKISLKDGLSLVGQRASADVKNFVTQGEQVPPPNAPYTLKKKLAKTYRGAAKGEPRTLVDTGRMINAVTYEVVASGQGAKGG